ncbi:MAG: DDE-type integrase/transposase/recombinase [Ardenticatenia bacterium]|nr:DDE-type integrase/transposase/recombinase [Ardenticatenia bacterium]
MKYTPIWTQKRTGDWLGSRLHALVVISVVLTALVGPLPESSLGWVGYPPQGVGWCGAGKREQKERLPLLWGLSLAAGWRQIQRTWIRALVRSGLLAVLSMVRMQRVHGDRWVLGWAWVLPWIEWLLEGISVAWPRLGRQAEIRALRWGVGWIRWGSLLFLGEEVLRQCLIQRAPSEFVGYGAMVSLCTGEAKEDLGPQVEIVSVEGGYHIQLAGEFHLSVQKDDTFWLRMVILFLRQLEGPAERRGGRSTRDGRRPLVPQQQLATGLGVPQPDISRWEKYGLQRDWANLLSLQSAEVLSTELRAQIIEVCARFPWWSQSDVYTYLRQQGVTVTHAQVQQAIGESGWPQLRKTMSRFFVIGAECIRPRDECLVTELLRMLRAVLDKVAGGEGLTAEERVQIAHLQTAGEALGLTPPPTPAAVPWAQKVSWILFAAEAPEEEGTIRCTYCGSTDVRPKGRQGRQKRYLDEQNQWRTVTVYRYRCRNAACSYGSFTHLPLGLLPYSPYPLQRRTAALQMYAWGRSSYRRTAQALGVRAGRVYLWVSAFGRDLLPVAALFGVVRFSGVVGIDEKWVQVPDKAPRGSGRTKAPKPRRWMYVYLAVDAYTYDLLHIALYARNSAHSTRAFLLALKAKGYQPKVIVTDLRSEYGPAIAEVFEQARHHECIFHALQWAHRQLKETYGTDYAQTRPDVVQLKERIDATFQAKTRRTAEKRYAKVMALRERYVAQTPKVDSVFDSLERHWPKLVNGIESTIVPRTNNATELVTLVPALQVQVSVALTSIIGDTRQGVRTSVVSSPWPAHVCSWLYLKRYIASRRSQTMLSRASGAGAHWSWLGMTWPACPWLRYARAGR